MTTTAPSAITPQTPEHDFARSTSPNPVNATTTKNPAPTEKREKKRAGRKSRYDPEFGIRICERIATTPQTLETICQAPDMPGVATVFRWLRQHLDFREIYVFARQAQAESLIEEALAIIDDSSRDVTIAANGHPVMNREALKQSKLQARQRLQTASKLLARKNRN